MPKKNPTDRALTIHIPLKENELLKDLQRAEKKQFNLIEERPLTDIGLDIFLYGLERWTIEKGIKI